MNSQCNAEKKMCTTVLFLNAVARVTLFLYCSLESVPVSNCTKTLQLPTLTECYSSATEAKNVET